MATVTECIHANFDLEPFSATNFYETDPKATLTMTQLNTFNEHNHPLLQNNTTKNISDTFVEKYKSELRYLQNPVKKWANLRPEYWTSYDVIDWLYYFADLNGIDCSVFRAEAFQDKNGQDLCLMNQDQFEELDPIYGKQIYDTFQQILHSCSETRLPLLNTPIITSPENSYTDLLNANNFTDPISMLGSHNLNNQATLVYNQNKTPSTKWINPVYTNNSYVHKLEPRTHTEEYDSTGSESVQSSTYSSSSSGECSPQYCPPHSIASTPHVYCPSVSTDYSYHANPNSTISQDISNQTNKRSVIASNSTAVCERRQTRGRRSGQGSKGTHLWEFIRDLLHDEKFCPGLIKWEDPNMGVFRFVQSEAVAQMWGKKKNNTSMTYEKLSRAMRYYYKREILVRVDGRRLVYRFGPRSYGWKKMCVNSKIVS